jgi:hypothetical protein
MIGDRIINVAMPTITKTKSANKNTIGTITIHNNGINTIHHDMVVIIVNFKINNKINVQANNIPTNQSPSLSEIIYDLL